MTDTSPEAQPKSTAQGDFLPAEYEFAHDFSMGLHDWMVGHIARGEANRLFDSAVTLRTKEHESELARLEGEDLLQWLEGNGYEEVVYEQYLKRLYPALLSDLLHFIFEALRASTKAKLTVAYALLRKPLRENLTYLEWILANPEQVLDVFHNHDSVQMSMSVIAEKRVSLERIRGAIAKTSLPSMHHAELLYDLRFDRSAEHGLEGMWSKAVHVVTTKDPIKTERRNLNFLFSDGEDRKSQWYFIYSRLPLVLCYAADVSDSLMLMTTGVEIPGHAEALFRRIVGMAVWNHEMAALRDEKKPTGPIESLDGLLAGECVHCQMDFAWDYPVLRDLYYAETVTCSGCGHSLTIQSLTSSPAED